MRRTSSAPTRRASNGLETEYRISFIHFNFVRQSPDIAGRTGQDSETDYYKKCNGADKSGRGEGGGTGQDKKQERTNKGYAAGTGIRLRQGTR